MPNNATKALGRNMYIRLGIVVLTILVIAAFGWAILRDTDQSGTDSDAQSTDSQTIQSDEVASGSIPEIKSESEDPNRQDSDQKDTNESRQVTITRATYKDNRLTVAAIVNGARADDICNLRLSKNGSADKVYSNPVVSQPSYYSCENFSIDNKDLPGSGMWNLVVEVSNAGSTVGRSDVQEISL